MISVQFKMITYSKVNRVTVATSGKYMVIERWYSYLSNYGGKNSGHSIRLYVQFLYSWTSVAWNQMAGTPSNSQILFLHPDNFVVNSLVNKYDFSDYFNFPIIRNKLLKLSVTPNTFCQSLQVWTIEVQLYVLLVTYTFFSYGSFFFSRWKLQCVYELCVCFPNTENLCFCLSQLTKNFNSLFYDINIKEVYYQHLFFFFANF